VSNELSVPAAPEPDPKRNELVVRGDMGLAEVAQSFMMSRFFKDVTSRDQALVKIMAGKELGLGPFSSMNLINVIQGKVVMTGHGIASLIDNSRDYDYEVDRLDDKGCTITFFKGTKKRGSFSFGEEDAKRAGLFKDNYNKYPRDMYFNRAISAGYKKYIPGVTLGAAVYVEGELESAPEPTKAAAPRVESPGVKKEVEEEVAFEVVPAEIGAFRDELRASGLEPAEFARRARVDEKVVRDPSVEQARQLSQKLRAITPKSK
jgi:hypothetical protein